MAEHVVSFTDVLFLLAPALLVFFTAYFLIKKFLDNQHRLKIIEVKLQTQKEYLPLRLQAYERLVLFLERIAPNNLLNRAYQPGMTVREFQMELASMIRQEFEHNITQQIYVSGEAWNAVRNAKEDVLKMIHSSASKLNPDDKSAELNRQIFDFILKEEWLPCQNAIDLLKKEVSMLY